MPTTIVIGTQWGDEGKGRIVDYFAAQADIIARYNGGDNAGHTVKAEDRHLKLHLVPSGILYPDKLCLIGAGTVINPLTLLDEIHMLHENDLDVSIDHLKIAAGAHLILPTHCALDGASEKQRGTTALGTTKRGIGPTYADKARRVGLRAGAMCDLDKFAAAVRELVEVHNQRLRRLYKQPFLCDDFIVSQMRTSAAQLAAHVVDGTALIGAALDKGQNVLCEGAQGTLLDINLGTYPFVTSSSPISGGALVGLGIGPKTVERVIGVAKAYTTRVGAGPFPTELKDATGERMRQVGAEFGVTTGRPRRCGWLDTVILRYAAQVNGLTDIALTKLDVLSGLPTLRLAVAYDINGERHTRFPAEWGSDRLAQCTPIYEDMTGWTADISDIRHREDLPANAQAYVARVEELTGVPINFISVGPQREAMIIVEKNN